MAVSVAAMAAPTTLRQSADGYRIELEIGPPEPFYPAQQAASDNRKSGSLASDEAGAVALNGQSHPDHSLVVSVFDEKTGNPVVDADVGLYLQALGGDGQPGALRSVPVAKMRPARDGFPRYGNNVRLDSTRYRISATVNGMDLTFFTDA
jgi:hypothetical protein